MLTKMQKNGARSVVLALARAHERTLQCAWIEWLAVLEEMKRETALAARDARELDIMHRRGARTATRSRRGMRGPTRPARAANHLTVTHLPNVGWG